MKRRSLTFVISLIFLLSSFMSITTLAANSVTQDGNVATLSMDKESYNLDEKIGITLTVANTNTYEVENITTEIILPSGVSAIDGNTKQDSFNLLPGESKTTEITASKKEAIATAIATTVVNTGDNMTGYTWGILAIISFMCLMFIAIRNKKIKKMNSLTMFLVMTLVSISSQSMIASASATDNVISKSFTVSETIIIAGEESTIQAEITYDSEETNSGDTVTVSFNTGEGSEVSPVTIEAGTALDYIPYTVLDGYMFDNWYTDISFTETFDTEAAINEDITIYAAFKESDIEYTEFESTEMALLDQATSFGFTVYSEETITSTNLSNYVQITEIFGSSAATGREVKYIVTSNGNNYTITADGGYDEGSMYEAVLLDGVTLVSPANDGYNLNVITTLTYSIYKEEVEIVEYKEDATFLEIDESLLSITNTHEELVIGYASITSEDLETILSNSFADGKTQIKVGDIIILKEGSETSKYGAVKVTSVDYDSKGNCTFSYEGCEYSDIYSSMDIYTEQDISVGDMLSNIDTVAMEQEIKQSEGIQELTYMLAVALSQSETVADIGDGTEAFTIDMDELIAAEQAISTMSTSNTLSNNVYFNDVSNNNIIELEDLIEGLTVSVTIGQVTNENMIDMYYKNDECFGVQVEVQYAVKLDNGVYVQATIDITESFVGSLCSSSSSYDDTSADFHYYLLLESETDIGFEILVCSAEISNDSTDEPEPDLGGSDFPDGGASTDEVPDISEYVDISKEIATTINDALTDEELEEENDNIVSRMLALLENEGDSIELFNAPIASGSFNVGYVFDINLYFNFVVSVDFAAGLQTEFSYINSQVFGVVGSTRTQDIEFYSYDRRSAGYSFDLYACGYLGVKAGIQSEISISMAFLKNVGEVGAGFEVGAYMDIYGYLHYNYVKTYYGGGTSQSLSGGIYMEMGVYIEAYVFARSNLFEAEGEWTVLDMKFPIFTVGNQYVYLELADEKNEDLSYGVLTGKYTKLYDILPTYYGEYLDITTGNIVVMPIEQSNKFGVYETSDIPYIRTTYEYDESGDWIPYIVFDQDDFNLYSNYYEAYGELRYTDYFYDGITYEDYYVGSSGDLYAEDIGLTITYCGDQLSTSLSTFREVGDVECIWVADGFNVENAGKVYTATFQFETTEGELIPLGTRTSIAGTQTGYFDIYANASEELIQQYALDEVYKFNDDGLGTYLSEYYTWDIDPTDNYLTEDTTFTVTAEERQSYVAYVYLDNGVYAYDVVAVTNGDVPEITVEDGSFYEVESVSLYNTNDYTTIYEIDYNNLPAVYTDASIDPQSYVVGQTGYSTSEATWTKSDAINQAKLFLGYYQDADLLYIANYDVDNYTVTYETNVSELFAGGLTEELEYNESPELGAHYAYSAKSYQTFVGWDANDDGEVDYTVDSDGNCNLPCTNEDVTYTAIYETGTYTISIEDYNGEVHEFEVEYMKDMSEEITDILEDYYLADDTELNGGIVKDFMWAYSYGDYTYKYYFSEDKIDETLEDFTGTYMTYYDSVTITPSYQTFYKMTVVSGEEAFDKTELAAAIETIETDYTYEYRDVTINADGTVSMYVLEDYAMQPSLFYFALVQPTIDDELLYYYDTPYWQDQDENEYPIGDPDVSAQEDMTFTAVYDKVEIEYSANVYTKTDGVTSDTITESFTGNYTDYQAFITEWETKYTEDEVTEKTDSTITTYTGYSVDEGDTSIDIYLEYTTETIQYTVTYSDDTGDLSDVQDIDYGTEITVASQDDVETDDYSCEFMGWKIGDTLYEVGESFTVTGYVTATAVWERTCMITFAYSEDSTAYKTYTGVVGEAFDMEQVPDYVMSGSIYEFTGWSDNPTAFTTNMTITVKYDYIDYTVTFELDIDGTVTTTTETAHYGDELSGLIPEVSSQTDGKIFTTWSIENIGTSDFEAYTITGDVTVKAAATTVYVTYMTGTQEYQKTAVDIGTEVTVLDAVTGYGSWSVSGATIENGTFTMPSSNVTFTAVADLTDTFMISDGTDTNVYNPNTYESSPSNTDISGYTFDTTNGILWINSNGFTLSGEVSNIVIIVDEAVTGLTLQDLTIQNTTKKTYTIPDFEWQENVEDIESDPINDFVIYAYGDEFNLTIDGDVEISQTNETDGRQYVIYYMNLKEGSYEKLNEETDLTEEASGLIPDAGTFTMTGSNDATFTASSSYAEYIMMINGAATISDIDFTLTSSNSYTGGIRVMDVLSADYNTVLSSGTLAMSNCTISGSLNEYAAMTYSSGNSIFTDSTFDITSGRINSDFGAGQMMSFIGSTSGSIPSITAQGLSFDLDTGCELVANGIQCYDESITLVDTSIVPNTYSFDSYYMCEYGTITGLTSITFTGN